MTADIDHFEAVVDALLRARQGGPAADDQALAARVSSPEQAYLIQERTVARLDASDALPRHWKSGGPTRADTMRHAPLPAAGVRRSGAAMDDLPLRHRWIEVEIALRLGRDVSPDDARQVTHENAGQWVDAMCVSIEVVDTRWAAGRDAPPLLKLADLLVHGALVLGEFVPYAARDWTQQECRVRIGAQEARSFRGSLGTITPEWVLPDWLKHLTRRGQAVPAGTVVTTGTWCGLLDAQAGDAVEVEFAGVGAARCRF